MIKNSNEKLKIKMVSTTRKFLFSDDIKNHILSPLSCLSEYATYWLLEFDLPLVNKKNIKIKTDVDFISVEARLTETYSEENLGKKIIFEYFKKTIKLPHGNDHKNITAKFENCRLIIIIPKKLSNHKIIIE